MSFSFGSYVLVVLNPDSALEDAVNEGIEKFFDGRWTSERLAGLYGWISGKGYSVLIVDRQNHIY